jgi:hypothetical protein
LQIAVPMSATFVGGPIRALLSSGLRLHSRVSRKKLRQASV